MSQNNSALSDHQLLFPHADSRRRYPARIKSSGLVHRCSRKNLDASLPFRKWGASITVMSGAQPENSEGSDCSKMCAATKASSLLKSPLPQMAAR